MGINNRRHPRRKIVTPAVVYGRDGSQIVTCTIEDLSAGGASLHLHKEIDLPNQFMLAMGRGGDVRRICRRVWQFSVVVGAQFVMT
jgi:PilZ domain